MGKLVLGSYDELTTEDMQPLMTRSEMITRSPVTDSRPMKYTTKKRWATYYSLGHAMCAEW
jgi:hypothetical protein